MRTLSLFGLVLGTALAATAQVQQALVPLQPSAAPTAPCGTDALHQHELEHNPAYQQAMQRFENDALQLDGTFQRDINTYKIPVVVHVMETGNDLTRISDEQIRDAIRAMNERFRRVAGTPGFGAGVDVGMEFVLAVRDPQGNCTNGITRRNMTGNATYMASGVFRQSAGISDASLKDVVRWDPTRYYNIWAVSEIDNNNGGNGVQGYAFFAGAHGMSMDGTVMLVNALRDPSDVTMTHELGHAMNVYHTFEGDGTGGTCPGNANCNNDGDLVCDTPPHRRSQSDCNSGGTNSCDGNSSNTLFVNNYMDYSSCGNMFTGGQAGRMVLALTTTRSSFLAANGNLSLVPVEAPLMDILPSRTVLCGTGQSIRLFTNATCSPNTWLSDSEFPGQSFSWTFTNGVSTYTSTAQNPTFTPATSGTYNATLSMTNALGTFTHTEQGVVLVSAAPVAGCTPTSSNTGNFAQTVHTVSFNTINNSTSSVLNAPYTDFSCTQNTVVARGGTYPLSIGIRAGGSAAQSVNAYIDYNNNGVFEDPSELVLTGSTPANSTTTLTANVTIPLTAVNNTFLRMRVYGEGGTLSGTERACGAAFFVGDVEDYGVYVSSNLAAVSIAAAPSNTITFGTNVTFTPTATNGGGAPTYQWFLNGDQVATSATYSNNTLLPGDQVYCRLFSNLAGVVASPATSNTVNMAVTGPPRSEFVGSTQLLCSGSQVSFTDQSLLSPTSWSWSFPGGTPSTSTAQNPTVTYSTPGTYSVTLTASNGLGTGTTRTRTAYITVLSTAPSTCTVTRSTAPAGLIGITYVGVGSIMNTTVYDDAVMQDFTCSRIAVLTPSTAYSISVGVSPVNDQWVRAYIDYNRDGDFVDAGENIFSPANGFGTLTGTFTTPASPVSGQLLRMRVISDFLNTVPGPCTTPLQYGQVEEYGIYFAPAAAVQLALRAVLEGPYNTGTSLMNDALRSLPSFPLAQPYNAAPWSYSGTETVAPAVLAVSGSNAVVDWVLVELRSAANNTTVVARRAGLLQRDGDVVATDGVSPLSFAAAAGNYHVALYHRNHLSVMSASAFALSGSPTTLDLSQSGTATFGTDARRTVGTVQALWAGDVLTDGVLRYTGPSNDRDPMLVAIGGSVPTNTTTGYVTQDVNLDGVVRYVGAANDRDILLQNIGGSVPTNTRTAQMP
jgi:PKD repeat protein